MANHSGIDVGTEEHPFFCARACASELGERKLKVAVCLSNGWDS